MKAPMIRGNRAILSDIISELIPMGYKVLNTTWPDESVFYLVTNAYGERGVAGIFPYSYVMSSRNLIVNRKEFLNKAKEYFCNPTSTSIPFRYSKEDLEVGMIVERRDGKKYLLIAKDSYDQLIGKNFDSSAKEINLRQYSENLSIFKYCEDPRDIIKVFKPNNQDALISIFRNPIFLGYTLCFNENTFTWEEVSKKIGIDSSKLKIVMPNGGVISK